MFNCKRQSFSSALDSMNADIIRQGFLWVLLRYLIAAPKLANQVTTGSPAKHIPLIGGRV